MSAVLKPREVGPLAKIYLHPGNIFIVDRPGVVSTILGSCVAVCLWDEESRIAGINHFLLPSNPLKGNDDARYGDTALRRLLDAMVERGAPPTRIVAKLFGGACVLDGFKESRKSIGDQNVAVARAFLAQHAIRLGGEQTGGRRGRKVAFDTGNGNAWVKEI